MTLNIHVPYFLHKKLFPETKGPKYTDSLFIGTSLDAIKLAYIMLKLGISVTCEGDAFYTPEQEAKRTMSEADCERSEQNAEKVSEVMSLNDNMIWGLVQREAMTLNWKKSPAGSIVSPHNIVYGDNPGLYANPSYKGAALLIGGDTFVKRYQGGIADFIFSLFFPAIEKTMALEKKRRLLTEELPEIER